VAEVSAVSSLYDLWHSSLIAVESQHFHFLTCSSTERIAFWFFTTPFDTLTWLAVWICVGAITGGIVIYGIVMDDGGNQRTNAVFSLTYYWATAILLEQSSEAPMTKTKKMEGFFGIQLLMGSWILMATILTNGYRSLAIMSLNAPISASFPDEFQVSYTNE
jgi:hypothetical protein